MMRHVLDEFPIFMRKATYSPEFSQECTTYYNLLLMAATKVCNYCETPGFTNQGLGNASVTLNGGFLHLEYITKTINFITTMH
jgi:hypothetical protein